MIVSEISVRVIYADTDAMGIVYHSNYMRWFEMGRTELLRSSGISPLVMGRDTFFFPLTKLFCHYFEPAGYDDLLMVETKLAEIKRASLRFDYRIFDDKRERCLAEGWTLHACTKENGKIVRVPEIISSLIKSEGDE